MIVVAIIGLLAAIAIPRFTSASQQAGEVTLKADLQALRKAIDFYALEHKGDWPGLRTAGGPGTAQSNEAFKRQLTWYTAENGHASATHDETHTLGPYLRKIPPLPVGSRAGKDKVAMLNAFSTPGLGGPSCGWEYEHYFGQIRANLPADEVGGNGVPYYEW